MSSARWWAAAVRPSCGARRLLAGALALVLMALPARAIELVTLRLGKIAGVGWEAAGVELRVGWTGHLELRIEHLRLPVPLGTFDGLVVRCVAVLLQHEMLSCPDGRLAGRHVLLDFSAARLDARYVPASGALDVRITGLSLAPGRMDVQLRGAGGRWTAAFVARGIDVARLAAPMAVGQAGIRLTGRANLAGTVVVSEERIEALTVEGELEDGRLSLAGTRPTLLGAGGEMAAQIHRAAGGWVGQLRAKLGTGRLEAAGHSLDLTRIPLSARGRFTYQAAQGNVKVTDLRLPLLDGELQVDELDVRGLGTPGLAARLRARLTPLSLARWRALTGQTTLGGSVALRVSDLCYQGGVLSLCGTAAAYLAGGAVEVDSLRLERPLEPSALLTAAFRMRDLDLASLSPLLGGGRIPARLDGTVSGLRVEAWQAAAIDADLHLLPQAGGPALDLSARLANDAWEARAQGRQVSLVGLSVALAETPVTFSDGRLDLVAEAAGTRGGPTRLDVRSTVDALSFSDAGALNVGQDLSGALRIHATQRLGGLRGEGFVELDHGELLLSPIYLDLAAAPLTLGSELILAAHGATLALKRLNASHRGYLTAQGEATLDLAGGDVVRTMRLRLRGELPGLYQVYLQPLLIGSALQDLETRGALALDVRYGAPAGVAISGALSDVTVEERNGRYGVERLAGTLDWSSAEELHQSHFGWAGGHVYRVPFGAGAVTLESRGNRLHLADRLAVPLLGGRLVVDAFTLVDALSPRRGWSLDAVLEPISLDQLTAALGWPSFGGQLSGVVPAVRYADDQLEVGGALLVRAFDGQIVVRDLELERPLGVLPVLTADLEADNLDLDALTRTFAFGRVQGRLSGRVAGLRLEDWQPVAFDARFATPPGDTSAHQISQRALDNLTSLGQGAGGAVSRTFLRIFENFSYDRLGISCRLTDGVCEMGGVAPAHGGGYYLVQGGGLPRIDVIGYARKVDWPTLLQRLKRITAQQAGPAVQ